jgi:fermentation-respiration switch protein FrsA (DUF1100 family)
MLQKHPRWARLARLTTFTAFVVVVLVMAMNITLAWLYISALTQPGCHEPQPLVNMAEPQEHWIRTEDGLDLRVWYYPSTNGAAILALGGVGGSLGDTLPPVMGLLEAGYGVLQVDGRACAKPPARVTLGADEVYAAKAGLEFLLERSEVDPERIGAFGFSMGGVTAIRVAATHPGVRALIAEGGYDNLGDHIVKPGAAHSFFRKIFLYSVTGAYWVQTGINPWEVSPVDDIEDISPRPVFLIYGEHELERGGGQQQFDAAKQPKELWIVPEGDHGSNHLAAPNEYERRVLEFFNQVLLGSQ